MGHVKTEKQPLKLCLRATSSGKSLLIPGPWLSLPCRSLGALPIFMHCLPFSTCPCEGGAFIWTRGHLCPECAYSTCTWRTHSVTRLLLVLRGANLLTPTRPYPGALGACLWGRSQKLIRREPRALRGIREKSPAAGGRGHWLRKLLVPSAQMRMSYH